MKRDEVIEHMRQAVAAAGVPDDRVRYEAESGEPAMTIVAATGKVRAPAIVCGIDFSTRSLHALRATFGLADRMVQDLLRDVQ